MLLENIIKNKSLNNLQIEAFKIKNEKVDFAQKAMKNCSI
jgi:hypothetical protein